MDMPRCRDCQWWDDNGTPKTATHRGLCHKAGDDLRSHDLMVTVGPAAARAALFTAPDFGCVQFEAKP